MTPPPEAMDECDAHAVAYMAAVGRSIGTSHGESVALAALLGVFKVARAGGLDLAKIVRRALEIVVASDRKARSR